MHLHLFIGLGDQPFALEMTAKCTKLKVLKFFTLKSGERLSITYPGYKTILFSSLSFLNVLNKSTSLQTLSVEKVELSDMVSPP